MQGQPCKFGATLLLSNTIYIYLHTTTTFLITYTIYSKYYYYHYHYHYHDKTIVTTPTKNSITNTIMTSYYQYQISKILISMNLLSISNIKNTKIGEIYY